MNTEKLISLIIKKQTYKETKEIQNQIFNQNTEASNLSIQAIKEILQTDYNAQAKLYSIRYLRDCFEKANPFFIERTQHQILPILAHIIRESTDQKSIMKYAGSYIKRQQLQKFKSIILSFFLMSKQCIKNWATWIPDGKRSFLDSFQKLKRQGVLFDQENTYFRDQHANIFFQNCKRNKLPYFEQSKAVQYSTQKINSEQSVKINTYIQKKPLANKKTKVCSQPIKKVIFESKMNLFKNRDSNIDKVFNQSTVLFDKEKINQKQISNLQNKFNEALNNYCQANSDLDQAYIQRCMDQFQEIKQILIKKSEGQLIKVFITKIKQSGFSSSFIQSKIKEGQNSINFKQPRFSSISENSGAFGHKTSDQKRLMQEQESSVSTIQKQNYEQFVYSDNFNDYQNQNFKKSKDNKFLFKENKKKRSINEEKLAKQISFANDTLEFQLKKSKIAKNSNQSNKNSKINFQQKSDCNESQKQDQDKYRYQSNQYQFIGNQLLQVPQLRAQNQDKIKNIYVKKEKLSLASDIPFSQKLIQEDLKKIQLKRQKQKKSKAYKLKQDRQIANSNSNYEIIIFKQQLNELKKQNQMLKQNNILLQRQIFNLKQQQKTMLQRLKYTVPIQQFNKIKKELYQQKKSKSLMQQKVHQFQQQINRLNKLIKQMNFSPKYNKIKSQQQFQLIAPRSLTFKNISTNRATSLTSRTNLNAKTLTERSNQDYQDNKIYPTKINNWLSNENTLLFKKSILGISQIFYQDKGVGISQQKFLTVQKSQVFLNINLKFQSKFFSTQIPKVKYQNIPQIDLWKKSLRLNNDCYQQQIIAKKCGNPLKIMKGHVQLKQNKNCTFLLPFLYFNYTVSQDFKLDQFLNIFSVKHEQVLKSLIFQLDNSIIAQINDFKKIFKYTIIDGKNVNFCLSQLGKQNVFMCQIEVVKSHKAVLRILPIPNHSEMSQKANQLESNLIFLLGL